MNTGVKLCGVALRKESVDRNHADLRFIAPLNTSLSARRAWIETTALDAFLTAPASLSARRAWIETVIDFPLDKFAAVALRKESVDRNSLRWLYDNP